MQTIGAKARLSLTADVLQEEVKIKRSIYIMLMLLLALGWSISFTLAIGGALEPDPKVRHTLLGPLNYILSGREFVVPSIATLICLLFTIRIFRVDTTSSRICYALAINLWLLFGFGYVARGM